MIQKKDLECKVLIDANCPDMEQIQKEFIERIEFLKKLEEANEEMNLGEVLYGKDEE